MKIIAWRVVAMARDLGSPARQLLSRCGQERTAPGPPRWSESSSVRFNSPGENKAMEQTER